VRLEGDENKARRLPAAGRTRACRFVIQIVGFGAPENRSVDTPE
jgi:hypothetical protein